MSTQQPRKKIAMIGKGVTFDSGGLSLKSSAGMQTMRCDMAGSAAVIGAFKGLKHIKPDVEVHGLIGAVENMLPPSYNSVIFSPCTMEKLLRFITPMQKGVWLWPTTWLCEVLGVDYMIDMATLTGANVGSGNLYRIVHQ